MGSSEGRPAPGPADSRHVRTLLYLGDGTMAGAILYLAVAQVAFLLSGLEPWMVGVVLAFLAIGSVHGWALLRAMRSQSRRSDTAQSRISEEWRAVRRWRWVGAVALPVAAVLVATTVLRWGWEAGWFRPDSDLLAVGALGFGLSVRLLVRLVVSRADGPVFRPGTRRGLAGFLVVLLGVVVVLALGGASMDVMLLAVVGVGGYALLYLLAAAGVD